MPAELEFPIGGISDGAVRLRPVADSDVPAVVEATRDPEIPRWTRVPEQNDEASVREWMRQSGEPGQELSLVVTAEDDESLLGAIGLKPTLAEHRCELGYWLAADARGRGHMTRAVRLLSEWALSELPIERVGILAREENSASRRVAERAGFTYEGVLRSYLHIKGRQYDMASYSLTRPFAQ